VLGNCWGGDVLYVGNSSFKGGKTWEQGGERRFLSVEESEGDLPGPTNYFSKKSGGWNLCQKHRIHGREKKSEGGASCTLRKADPSLGGGSATG